MIKKLSVCRERESSYTSERVVKSVKRIWNGPEKRDFFLFNFISGTAVFCLQIFITFPLFLALMFLMIWSSSILVYYSSCYAFSLLFGTGMFCCFWYEALRFCCSTTLLVVVIVFYIVVIIVVVVLVVVKLLTVI